MRFSGDSKLVGEGGEGESSGSSGNPRTKVWSQGHQSSVSL